MSILLPRSARYEALIVAFKNAIRTNVSASIDILFRILSVLVTCLSALYLIFALYGFARGYALPTTAVFRLAPKTEQIIYLEPYFSVLFLAVAAIGASISWMGWVGVLERNRIARLEVWLESLVRLWGSLTVLSLLLVIVSSGGWVGRSTGHPSSNWDILNLLPWSDAITYFGSSLDRASLDVWGATPARRPLAQSLRDALVFVADYSHTGTILLQTVLVAYGVNLTAGRILHWRGPWAAIAFIGLVLGLVREFLGTMMTEPIGYAIAFFSCAYLCDAIRFRSRAHAAVALLGITTGLVARAGSLLTIPFLVIWATLALNCSVRARVRFLMIGTLCAGGVFAVNALVNFLYSPPGVVSGASISLTLCGLSVGGSWGDCYVRLYGSEIAALHGNEHDIMMFLMQKALENALGNPLIVFNSMVRNSVNYVQQLPGIFLNQMELAGTLAVNLLFGVILLSVSFDMWRRVSKGEAVFWFGLFLSTLASAAIIYADDGFRTMQVTYAVFAVVLAFSCASPMRGLLISVPRPLDWRIGAGLLALVLLVAVCAPAISHVVMSQYLRKNVAEISRGPNDAILLASAGLAGFLVLPDGAERPIRVPSVYYSEFLKIPQVKGFKRGYEVDFDAFQLKPPFALVIGMRLDKSCCYYVTPPEVLLDSTVKAWHLSPLQETHWAAIRAMKADPVR